MSYAEKIFRGVSVALIMQIISSVIAYVLRLFIARNLSVAEFGLLYAIISFVGLFTVARDLGFGQTLVKYISEFNTRRDYGSIKSAVIFVIAIELALGFGIALILFALSGWLSTFYFKADASLPFQIMTISFALSGLLVVQFVFQGMEKIKHYASVEVIRNAVTLVSVVFLIGMGITGVTLAYLIASIVVPAVFFVLAFRMFPFFSVKLKITKALVKNLTRFSVLIVFAGVGGTILGYIDTLAITLFLSLDKVGLYQAALPTSQILWTLSGSVAVVLLPMASSLWAKKDTKTLSRIIGLLMKFSFVLIIPFVIIMVAFPDTIIRLLFSDAYLQAAGAFQILTITSLFYTMFSTMVITLIAIGKPSVYMRLNLLLAGIAIILNLALVPLLGIVGAALATLFAYIIGSAVSIVEFKKIAEFKFYWYDMAKAFAAGALILALVFVLKNSIVFNPWAMLVALGIFSAVVYAVIIIKTRALTRDDIALLRQAGVPIPKVVLKIIEKI